MLFFADFVYFRPLKGGYLPIPLKNSAKFSSIKAPDGRMEWLFLYPFPYLDMYGEMLKKIKKKHLNCNNICDNYKFNYPLL